MGREINTDSERTKQSQGWHDNLPIDIFLGLVWNICLKVIRALLSLDVRRKKAISLTVIFAVLTVYLNELNIFSLGRITDSDAWHLSDRFFDYSLFFVLSLPAIYFLYLNFRSKNTIFRVSLAWLVGMIVFRLNSYGSWSLSENNYFISCAMTASFFALIALLLSYFLLV